MGEGTDPLSAVENLIVQKYGGTSVGDLERIGRVADRIARTREKGSSVVAVVSAMAGETDRLLKLGRNYGGKLPPRELDVLVATGEQLSSSLLAIALANRGVPAVSLLGFQVPVRTTEQHGSAQIDSIEPWRIRRHLEAGEVVVVAGYQGITERGDLSTLGRGGSDLSAVALAAALDADLCEICTDVPGVFTADPQIVGEARPITRLSYDEMLELASLGAKVLQARSVQMAKRYQIPVWVRSTFDDSPGTCIRSEEKTMEATVVSAISCDRNDSKISLRDLPSSARAVPRLFGALAEAQIVVDVIVQDVAPDGTSNLSFTVPRGDFGRALDLTRKIVGGVEGASVLSHEQAAKVSAVGLGMRTHSGVASRVFAALAREGIEVMAVATSEIKISCVIDDRYAELAVRCLHDEFGLAKEPN